MKTIAAFKIFVPTLVFYFLYTHAQTPKFKVEKLENFNGVVWGFDFLNQNELVLTLRSGQMFKYNLITKKKTAIENVPPVHAKGQGGLLDIRVSPVDNKIIYFTYSLKPKTKEATTALARAELKEESLVNFKVLIETQAYSDENIHFGSRVEFDDQNNLFMTVGDRNKRFEAQSLEEHNGKVLRVDLNGEPHKDNPFNNDKIKSPYVFTYGHRNSQGLAFDKINKKLWLAEFGPRGGDELNLIVAGLNYGWPEVTYGREYWGTSIGVKEKPGTEQPKVYWVPSISPSGIAFYTGDRIKNWKNNLFVANLSGMHLRRLVVKDEQIVEQEELLSDMNERFRNVRSGLDGYLYFSTDSGLLARLVPL